MNDLEIETQIRDTFRRHEDDVPRSDPSDAPRAAVRTRRRQILNVAAVGAGGLVAVITLTAVVGGLVRADRRATVLDTPPPATTSVPTPNATDVHPGLPGAIPAPAGIYSWSARGSAWIHNTTGEAGGFGLQMTFATIPEIPQGGGAPVTVAGYDGIYRELGPLEDPAGRPPLGDGGARATTEEWIVDIDGTVVAILLAAPSDTPEAELAAAHAIIDSIHVVPEGSEPGFRLTFELPYGWDRG